MQCRLTERVEIEYCTTKQDNQGFIIKNWSSYYKCWACFQTISGKEYEAAKAIQSQDIVTFTIRYCKKVKDLPTKEYRLKFRNKFYDIQYIYDVNNQHNFVDIKCKCIE